MLISEFSDQFDVLYNNITSNQAPGLNEYEKSLFLTKAEKEIVKNYFTANSKGNIIGQGFDDSAKRQADFSVLMKTSQCLPVKDYIIFTYNNTSPAQEVSSNGDDDIYIVYDGERVNPNNPSIPQGQTWAINEGTVDSVNDVFSATWTSITIQIHGLLSKIHYTTQGLQNNSVKVLFKEAELAKIDPRSGVYSFPDDTFIVINESLYTDNQRILQVIPLRYDEYTRLMSKPFKRPLKNQAWRLISSGEISGTKGAAVKYVEIITNSWDENHIEAYNIRYVRVPKPIIVAELGDLTIDGEHEESTSCEIDPILHEDILQRAVELAKVAWTVQGNENTQLVTEAGQRSE